MKQLAGVLLFLALGPGVVWAAAEPLTCTIRGPTTFPWGSSPHFDVEIRNQTGRDILLVGSLDGSDERWRYPHCYFEVLDSGGRSTVVHPARCGNLNPLRENDFVSVPAGESFDPYMPERGFFYPLSMNAETFREPGEYRVRFVYSTGSERLAAWINEWFDKLVDDEAYEHLPENKEALESLLAQVPKARVVSNEVRIQVTEKPK